ncbi:MAG: hypothetical protein HOQ24_18805, partial [Mycobacteriaceae bacterium]|nr:hypothetical protein [Mycobacteriaceae bacterium]
SFAAAPTVANGDVGPTLRPADVAPLFAALTRSRPAQAAAPTSVPPTTVAPSTTAAPTSAMPRPTAVTPSSASVKILNGTGRTGVGSTVATKLGQYGFTVTGVQTYTDGARNTRIRYAPGREAEAATVATAIPGAQLEPEPSLGRTVELLLGADFAGTVTTPAHSGEPVPPNLTWSRGP